MTTLAERFKKALDYSGTNITDVAKKVRITQSAVSQWASGETKKIASDKLFDAARALSVNPEWLATGKGDMKRSGDNRTASFIQNNWYSLNPQIRKIIWNIVVTELPEIADRRHDDVAVLEDRRNNR